MRSASALRWAALCLLALPACFPLCAQERQFSNRAVRIAEVVADRVELTLIYGGSTFHWESGVPNATLECTAKLSQDEVCEPVDGGRPDALEGALYFSCDVTDASSLLEGYSLTEYLGDPRELHAGANPKASDGRAVMFYLRRRKCAKPGACTGTCYHSARSKTSSVVAAATGSAKGWPDLVDPTFERDLDATVVTDKAPGSGDDDDAEHCSEEMQFEGKAHVTLRAPDFSSKIEGCDKEVF
jgi:hypothetical protein